MLLELISFLFLFVSLYYFGYSVQKGLWLLIPVIPFVFYFILLKLSDDYKNPDRNTD